MKEINNRAILENELKEYNTIYLELINAISRNNYSSDCWVLFNEFPFINVITTVANMYFNENIRVIILRTKGVSGITYEYTAKGFHYFNILVKVSI
jgi:hypothetical protein